MTIGERIKYFRKENHLTQEQLADYLHVSYQAVSKWENGVSSPDLSLIAPLTDLFRISADELLGLSQRVRDERKAYFEAEYFEYWKKEDHEADHAIAKRAVEEYPSELKYWKWLGAVEYYIAFRRKEQTAFIEMMDASIKHNLMVWENSTDDALRSEALWTIICAYRYSGRISEARKYAERYPKRDSLSREDALALCLEGEELLSLRQKMLVEALENFCGKLGQFWLYETTADARARAAVYAEKSIIESIISDGNLLFFSWYLYRIHEKLADFALTDGDADTAVMELKKAYQYANQCDLARVSGKQYYTAPLLDRHFYDYSECRELCSEANLLLEDLRKQKKYEPLRDREDFKALLQM